MGKIVKEEDLRLNIIVNGNDTRKKIGDLTRSVQDLNAENKKLDAERKKLRDAGQKDSQQYRELTAKIETNKATMKGYQQQINSLRSSMKVSEMTMGELQQRAKQLSAQLRNAAPGTKQYTQLNNQLKQVNNRFAELKAQTKGMAGITDKLGLGNVQAFVGKLFIYYNVLKGIFNLFSGGINKIKDFEQANVNLSTILGVSLAQMTGLTKSALELGRTTEYTASQVTNLQTELAKLGFGQQAIMGMQKPILQFATAVGADLPEAAALAGATLRAFDKDASDAEEVLATMAVATNKSALSFAYLRESMSIVAPVAKTFGFDIKDVVTLLGSLANSGFDASSAATATRNILLNLADANGKLAKELGKPVHSLPELISGLQKLDQKGINLSKTLELTDKRSVAAFNTFLHGTGTMTDLRDAVEDVDGELKRISEERLQTVEGQTKILESAWEGLMLSFYNSRGAMRSVVEGLTEIVTAINDLIDPEARVERRINDLVEQLVQEYAATGEQGYEAYYNAGKSVRERQAQKPQAEYKFNGNVAMWVASKFGRGAAQHRSDEFDKRAPEEWDQAKIIADQQIVQHQQEEAERKARDADEKKRKEAQQRQEAAAAAYIALTQKEITERTTLKKKYLDGDIATEEEYNEQLLQLNIDALQRRLKSGELKGKERLTAEEQLTTLLLQQKKQEQDKLDKIEAERIKSIADTTERENAEYALRRRQYQGNTKILEQIDAQHKRNLAKIQLDKINTSIQADEEAYKRERRNLKNQQASELLSFTGTAEEKKKLRKQHNEELAEIDAKYARAMSEKLQQLLDNGNFEGLSLDSAVLSDEEKDKLSEKLLTVKELLASLGIEVQNLHGADLNVIGTTDLLGFTQDNWETLFENLKEGKIGVQEIGMAITAMSNVFGMYDKFATAAETRQLKQFKKNNDAKKKDLERRLDLGLINQEEYNTKSQQLDDAYEAKREEAEIKQARRQKSMSIVEAIVNTAVGITSAMKLMWPLNLVIAAMVGAMGAAQVALIASQPIGGAEEGSFLVTRAQDGKKFNAAVNPGKRGYVDKPTVITGENGLEYIIPNEAMENPTARPIIGLFETVRKQGRLADFDFEEVLPALYATPGRAAGGSISSAVPTDSAGGSPPFLDGGEDTKKILEYLKYLCDKADDPTPAVFSMMGRGGFVEEYNKYLKLKRNGQLGV